MKACERGTFSQIKVYEISTLFTDIISKGVFERRMPTGNETFSLFTRLGAATFVILSVVTLIETIYLKIRAHPLPKNEKRPLPVAVGRSKTPLLKLPNVSRHLCPSVHFD